jgi:hypothetical protein
MHFGLYLVGFLVFIGGAWGLSVMGVTRTRMKDPPS